MESRLKKIYAEASLELEEKASRYFAQFDTLDEKKRAQVKAGKLSEKEYKRWRRGKMLYGERWNRLKDHIANEYGNIRKTALEYINGELPKVYSENYNFIGTSIGGDVRGYSFDLVNADTVRELASVDKTFLPYEEINGAKHFRWCTKEINAEILKGIMLGDSIPDLAKRLRTVSDMEASAAVRNARTMVTSAENKARQDGFERAKKAGIIIKREWIAAMDGRVRHAHALLSGQLADVDKPFRSELGDIMYPGDPSAHPANVYNCRCTLGSKIIGFRRKDGSIERV
jgi:SPP1 gp7 family putative phage head morphogenesis protein